MELDLDAGERIGAVDAGERRRMPADRDVDIVEGAGAHQEALARAAFLSRAAIIAHAPLHALRGEPVLDRSRREQRSRAQHVVPAAMTVAVLLQRALLG